MARPGREIARGVDELVLPVPGSGSAPAERASVSGLSTSLDTIPTSVEGPGNIEVSGDSTRSVEATRKRWRERKKVSEQLAEILTAEGLREGERMASCSSWIAARWNTRLRGLRQVVSSRCGSRWCPICAALRAQAWVRRVTRALPQIEEAVPGGRWAFATFTMPNVTTGPELRSAYRAMVLARRSLRHRVRGGRKWWPGLGGVWSFEVPPGTSGDEYNLHLHALLLMPADYAPGSLNYRTQAEVQATWEELLGEERAIVDLRFADRDGRGVAGAVVEVLKYATKGTALVGRESAPSGSWWGGLVEGLRGSRTVEVTGLLREHVRADEPADAELDDEGPALSDFDVGPVMNFVWSGGVTGEYRFGWLSEPEEFDSPARPPPKRPKAHAPRVFEDAAARSGSSRRLRPDDGGVFRLGEPWNERPSWVN